METDEMDKHPCECCAKWKAHKMKRRALERNRRKRKRPPSKVQSRFLALQESWDRSDEPQ